MKHTASTTVKFSKALWKVHQLKVKYLNNNELFKDLSNIYSDIELLFNMYNKSKLTDKEKAILIEVKKEKIADKVRQSYKKKLNKARRLLDNAISSEERKKVGYLKYRARLSLNNQPPPQRERDTT